MPAGKPSPGTPESIDSDPALEEPRSGPRRAQEISGELARLGALRQRVAAQKVGLMLAETREDAFSEAGWIFELKYDGFRVLASKDGDDVHLFYRRGADATATYPEIARAVSGLPFESLVLDTEVTVLDDRSRSSFQRLQKRALLQRRSDIARASVSLPATLYVFDLLAFDEFDLRGLPLVSRKEVLKRILPKDGPLRYVDHIEEQGEALYEEVRGIGLEGLVAKRADSTYRAGRSPHWQKIRIDRSGDFVIVGLSPPQGLRAGFGALHLGAYQGEQLVYTGRVGSGFTEEELGRIPRMLEPDRRATAPCTGPVPTGKGHVWVEPLRVCEVRYKEWTAEHLLRQPVFLRLRDDKGPEECLVDSLLRE